MTTQQQATAIDRETLRRVYSEHEPTKVEEIDSILLKRLGNTKAMREMYEFLSKKYSIDCEAIRQQVTTELQHQKKTSVTSSSSSSSSQANNKKKGSSLSSTAAAADGSAFSSLRQTAEEVDINVASADIQLEVTLTVAIVGSMSCGKTSLVQKILDKNALQLAFDPTNENDDDDPPHAHPEEGSNGGGDGGSAAAAAATRDENKTEVGDDAADNNNNNYQQLAEKIIPSLDSVGVNFQSTTVPVGSSSSSNNDNFVKRVINPQNKNQSNSLACVLRLQCFDLGGATCCGTYADPTALYQTVSKCDVVVAVYDLCDKSSLASVVEDLLPILQAAKVPIIVVGNKIDMRKKLVSSEQRKSAVAGADQKKLDAKISSESVNAIVLGSTAATSSNGTGLMRLRRQIIFDALHRRKDQISSEAVFVDPSSFCPVDVFSAWTAFEDEVAALQKSSGIVKRKTVLASGGGAKKRNQEQTPTSRAGRGRTGGGDGDDDVEPTSAGGGGRGGEDVPVVDASSSSSKKKTSGEDGENDEDPDKGKGVMCGCQSCVIC